jgi:CheY-like chemotaxis protein
LQKILDAGKQQLALIQNSFHPNGASQRPAEARLEENTTPPEQDHFEESSEYATPAEAVSDTPQGLLLIVDDLEANRDVLSRRLRRRGYLVANAENGQQALKMMQINAFDLVLLDIMMPEMDGYEVLHRLKSDQALSHIPVIMISASNELDAAVRCIEMGAEDCLPKPFNPTLLKARIGACLVKKCAKQIEHELGEARQLLETSREAGMAEVRYQHPS